MGITDEALDVGREHCGAKPAVAVSHPDEAPEANVGQSQGWKLSKTSSVKVPGGGITDEALGVGLEHWGAKPAVAVSHPDEAPEANVGQSQGWKLSKTSFWLLGSALALPYI